METGKEKENTKSVNKENTQVRMTSKNLTNIQTPDYGNSNTIQRFSIKIPHISQ